ncbi:MAG TPA: acyl-CoA desaturase [Chryseolinea sp.]|nr:acyl-CoA desaturase [Chryseolinea sp.]
MLTYTFHNNTTPFFRILKEKVDQYFVTQHLDKAGNVKVYRKSIILLVTAASLYTLLVFFTLPIWVTLPLCMILGFTIAVIGFNVMHEGGHQSFSKHAWVNSLSAYSLNMLGGNSYFWKIKHNINHHTYTNIEGMDSDIDVKPFMRLHEGQPRHGYHRFQSLYWIILYGISYIAWVFYEDFKKYFSSRVSGNSNKKGLPLREHVIFWFSKIMYVLVYIVVPVIMVGWLSWLIGFLIITFFCGLTTSIVFQLAHVVEGTQFSSAQPADAHAQDAKQEWAVHQILSTSNFATSSKLWHWLLGGLNFQIEHHLFPRISHIHYPAISRFVKEACSENHIVYAEYKSMRAAVLSHLKYLHKLGRT